MGCSKSSSLSAPGAVTVPTVKTVSPRSETGSVTRSIPDTVRSPVTERFTDPTIMLKQYAIGEVIGTGAFAQVKRVTHKATGQVRALKVIHKSGLVAQHIGEDLMLQELRILQTLVHPNILHLFEWYEDKLRYYLVTELCPGGELFGRITSATRLTEAEVAKVMHQVLSAVAFSHSKGVIHRDLKPENLFLIGEDLELKVADFGSSAFLDRDRKLNGVFGSGYYIAPEVMAGAYDEKCDVWSCGIILYILLTGCPPYPGRNEQEILAQIKAGHINLTRMKGLSSDSIQLILKMLEPDPGKRVSALEAVGHSWVQRFREEGGVAPRALPGTLENLRSFNNTCKLKDAILSFIASQIISQSESKELGQVFHLLDRNGDGRISKPELKAKYSEAMGDLAAEAEVTAIMGRIDTDNSGFIDYGEFLKANVERTKHASKQNLEAAFRMFDRDGNGKISAEELRWVLTGGGVVGGSWEELLSEVDQNHDGEIDLREFMSLVQAKL